MTPTIPQLASIPTTTEGTETRADAPAAAEEAAMEEPAAKAKRKRAARKAKRPARRSLPPAQVDAFGYPANNVSTANRPAQGFWGPFN